MPFERKRLLTSSLLAGASVFAIHDVALAQAASPTPAAASEAVVVTGSRIRQPNLTSVSPLTVVSDQEIKLQGASNIENLLNGLPQITAGQQSNVSNGSTGTATVDLRNLGAARTLVLVDGKRLMPGDPGLPVADLNNIPSALVERVDVVTGGASAVYGADAVAGVVNFIMKKNFQGAEIDAQYGYAQHQNSNTAYRSIQGKQGVSTFPYAPSDFHQELSTEVSAIIGLNSPDDKGNITAYATYRNLKAVTQDKYDVSACSVASTATGSDSYLYNAFRCSGSSNTAYGRFNVVNASDLPGASTRQLHDALDGSKTFITSSVPRFNYGPLNYIQRPEERYTGGFFGHYRFNEHAEFYTDLMFTDDHTVAQIAPSGFFAGSGSFGNSYVQINCNNPLMSAQQQSLMCGSAAGTGAIANVQLGFRFVGANRQDDLRHTNYKVDVGFRGEFVDGWRYDAYLQYGTSIYSEHYLNDVSIRKAQNAILVDPTTGKCFNDAAACVPINIFQVGGPSQAALNYVLTPGYKSGQTVEQIASLSVTGDLGRYGVRSPWAATGVALALGTEYRREGSALTVDDEFASGDLSGQGGPTKAVSGSFDVYELFGELRAPLVEDKPFVKSLTADAGYRWSDYGSTSTNTYKVEGDWAVNRDIRFRAGYNRAVRAPNIVELFAPASVGNTAAADPCAGDFVASQITAGCLATFARTAAERHLTAQQFVNSLSSDKTARGIVSIGQWPAAQCSGLFSGSTHLQPESADTYTAGVVFTPTLPLLRRFSASIDYFNIEVDNIISAPGAIVVLNECTNLNVAAACGLIRRDPGSGILYGFQGYTDQTLTNQGYLKTSGFDVLANYKFVPEDVGLPRIGTVSVSLIGTYTEKLVSQPLTGGPTYDCAGLYGPTCGTPQAHWKHRVRFTYEAPRLPITLSFDWRYQGAVKLDANEGNAGATPNGVPVAKVVGNSLLASHPSGVTDAADARIKAYSWFDISGTWRVRPNLNLRFGVNNILDKDPPRLDSNVLPAAGPSTGNGNTYPGVYDTLGRTLFIGLTADF